MPANAVLQAGECDAFIAVQDWWSVFGAVPARVRLFWTGDAADQYMNFGIGDKRVISRINAFIGVSDWHVNHMCEHSGFPREKAFSIFNGVHLPWFEGSETRNKRRLIYTSTPYRGLDLVPQIYTKLRERFSDLELHVFAGLSVYDREKPFQGPEAQHFARIRAVLEKLPGCTVHGNVLQSKLAREYMKSGIFFYPNTFYEMSCITALEAQAAGCPIVTSALGALPETVGDAGITIQGPPGTPDYTAAFASACEKILTDENLWNQYSENGKRRVREKFTWELAAGRLEKLLEKILPQKN